MSDLAGPAENRNRTHLRDVDNPSTTVAMPPSSGVRSNLFSVECTVTFDEYRRYEERKRKRVDAHDRRHGYPPEGRAA